MKKSAFIFEDNHNKLEQFSEIQRKANELEQALERLKWSEARMRHFAQIAADWFWETDEDHHVIWSSDGPIRERDRLTDAFSGCLAGLLPTEHCAETLAALKEGRAFQDAVLELELESGERASFRLSGEPLLDSTGHFSGFRGVGRDITRALRLCGEAGKGASHDELTGLLNRREFQRRVQRAWLRSRQEGAVHAVCFLDLDRFKKINEDAGLAAGDALLIQIAEVMRSRVRAGDALARMGGDEFCVLLENCALENAVRYSDKLLAVFRELRFEWQGMFHPVGASIGITLITPETEDSTRALLEADLACYTAKKLGRDQVQIYRQTDCCGHTGGA